jgi:type IV pilus assembly protein PilP
MTRRVPAMRLLTGSLLLALLAGCGAENEELQEWMERQRREVKPNVSPLSPPKKFEAQPYSSAQAVDPFSNQKLTVALKMEARKNTETQIVLREIVQDAAGEWIERASTLQLQEKAR